MPYREFPNHRTEFTSPPLDGSLFIPQIYDFHYEHNPNHPLFKYDRDGSPHTVTWGLAVEAIYRASNLITSHVSIPSESRPVVAILAVIDQLTYFALIAGVMRAGFQVFPISPRNSDVGAAKMMQKMGVSYVFVSGDQAMQSLAERACQRLTCDVQIIPTPSFDYLYQGSRESKSPPVFKATPDDIALVLHSSGSTSFPKPIPLSYRNLLQWGIQPYYGDIDICGKILSNHSLPFFHAMGVVSLQWATMTGVTLSNFEPCDPPIVSTPDRLYSSALNTESNLIFCVPSFLEEWSQDPERVAELRKFDGVMFGGAPIQKAVGDKLVQAGVKLYPFYGATEIGGTCKFVMKSPPTEGWEYFEISDHCETKLVKQDGEEDIYQLVFLKCPTHNLAVSNAKSENGIDGYDTNDLVIRHPTNPRLFKIFGRADDQIMHSTGEKTNPVPIETIINRNPVVNHGIIFGRGRFQAGILIEPVPSQSFDPADLDRLSAFRNLVWPTVEKANQVAPSHSRIFKEMILVTHPSKPFHYTAKGTPRRHLIIDTYADEIEAAYKAIEESSQEELAMPVAFNESECIEFLRNVVGKVLRQAPSDEDDLFQVGCDSLQATWIRNSLLRCLRAAKVDTKAIPINFVYLDPSILGLARYMVKLVNPSGDPSDSDTHRIAETVAQMESMVKKYTQDFPIHVSSTPTAGNEIATGECVLLTGSTGGLGSHVLENLLADEKVWKIYALNRKDRTSRSSILERQTASFIDRDLNAELLKSEKLVLVEADAGSIEGVDGDLMREMSQAVTSIIHNAWRVDFNVALSSMEPLVKETRNLINFSLQSTRAKPPRLVFVSSIGVARNYPHGIAPESPLLDPAYAVGSGYPESKWVTERVLHGASTSSPGLEVTIIRIGQMSGSYRNGNWNPHEWVPSIIKSSLKMGCLPKASGVISWIPVDIAASALLEMALSSPRSNSNDSTQSYFHIVHPRPIKWNDLFESISRRLDVPLVPYGIWFAKLQESVAEFGNGHDNDHPALRLLDFYQSALDKPLTSEDAEAFGFPRLSTDRAVEVASSLRVDGLSFKELGVDDIDRWLAYWKALRFI